MSSTKDTQPRLPVWEMEKSTSVLAEVLAELPKSHLIFRWMADEIETARAYSDIDLSSYIDSTVNGLVKLLTTDAAFGAYAVAVEKASLSPLNPELYAVNKDLGLVAPTAEGTGIYKGSLSKKVFAELVMRRVWKAIQASERGKLFFADGYQRVIDAVAASPKAPLIEVEIGKGIWLVLRELPAKEGKRSLYSFFVRQTSEMGQNYQSRLQKVEHDHLVRALASQIGSVETNGRNLLTNNPKGERADTITLRAVSLDDLAEALRSLGFFVVYQEVGLTARPEDPAWRDMYQVVAHLSHAPPPNVPPSEWFVVEMVVTSAHQEKLGARYADSLTRMTKDYVLSLLKVKPLPIVTHFRLL